MAVALFLAQWLLGNRRRERQVDRQTDRETGRQAGKQRSRPMDRSTERHRRRTGRKIQTGRENPTPLPADAATATAPERASCRRASRRRAWHLIKTAAKERGRAGAAGGPLIGRVRAAETPTQRARPPFVASAGTATLLAARARRWEARRPFFFLFLSWFMLFAVLFFLSLRFDAFESSFLPSPSRSLPL